MPFLIFKNSINSNQNIIDKRAHKAISILTCIFLCTVFAIKNADAKAAYKSMTKMIKSADVIVYGNIAQVKDVSFKGKRWKYSQQAIFKPEKFFKGQLPKSARIYGGEDFICAKVQFKTGKSLLFLSKVDGYYIGNNWHLSALPEKANQINWFSGKNKYALSPKSKAIVFNEIEAQLAKMTNSKQKPYLISLSKAKLVSDELIGEGGEKSIDFANFKKALSDKSIKKQTIEAAFKQASAAGKIYLAMILMKHDKPASKLLLNSMTKISQDFEFQSGCEIMNYSLKNAANELLDTGKLLTIDPLKL